MAVRGLFAVDQGGLMAIFQGKLARCAYFWASTRLLADTPITK